MLTIFYSNGEIFLSISPGILSTESQMKQKQIGNILKSWNWRFREREREREREDGNILRESEQINIERNRERVERERERERMETV